MKLLGMFIHILCYIYPSQNLRIQDNILAIIREETFGVLHFLNKNLEIN